MEKNLIIHVTGKSKPQVYFSFLSFFGIFLLTDIFDHSDQGLDPADSNGSVRFPTFISDRYIFVDFTKAKSAGLQLNHEEGLTGFGLSNQIP